MAFEDDDPAFNQMLDRQYLRAEGLSDKEIDKRLGIPCQPQLGCATTRELLEEIAARMEILDYTDQTAPAWLMVRINAQQALVALDAETLNYRTVNH